MGSGEQDGGGASTRVLLVDDHRMFAELLTRSLAEHADMTVVGVARTGEEALARTVADEPDVVVLDYGLPGDDGVTVAARLRRALPEVRLVMLTGHDDDRVLRAALRAGCTGFVTKDRAAEELVRAVRTVRGGGAAIDAERMQRLAEPLPAKRKPEGLTERELDVLELLSEGASTRQIADRLFISVNTTRNHVQRVIRKLGAHSRLEAVSSARRRGLVREPPT